MGSDKSGRKTSAKTNDKKKHDRNMGDALRAVYHETVSETVPDEMLELLRKLG